MSEPPGWQGQSDREDDSFQPYTVRLRNFLLRFPSSGPGVRPINSYKRNGTPDRGRDLAEARCKNASLA